jgi:hypothetical protein
MSDFLATIHNEKILPTQYTHSTSIGSYAGNATAIGLFVTDVLNGKFGRFTRVIIEPIPTVKS